VNEDWSGAALAGNLRIGDDPSPTSIAAAPGAAPAFIASPSASSSASSLSKLREDAAGEEARLEGLGLI